MYEGPDAQETEKIFVLGNGPSRKNIDPSKSDLIISLIIPASIAQITSGLKSL